MVKDHSDSERGNPVPPHGLLFPINSKGSFISIIHARISHTTAFVTPFVEHWLEREIAQWVLYEGVDPTTHRTMSERSNHGATSRSGHNEWQTQVNISRARLASRNRTSVCFFTENRARLSPSSGCIAAFDILIAT